MEQNQTAPQTNEIQYAGFWKRFLAYWVDVLITLPLSLVLLELLGMEPFALFSITTMAELEKLQSASNNTTILSMAIGFLFYIIMWVNYDGATPGKKLVGIKIQKNDGSKVNYPTAIIRYLGYFISAIVACLGFLWVAWDKKKQGWHDKIAGTVVVKTGEKSQTGIAIFLTIISIIIMTVYMGAAFVKGIQIGLSSAQKDSNNLRPANSQQEYKEAMSPEAKKHYETSQELFGQIREVGDNVEAIKPVADRTIAEAKLAVDADPKNPILWSNLGDAYTWPNTVDTTGEEGLKAYNEALKIDPNNVIYSNYVGDQLIRMGRYDEAVLQLKKSIRITNSSGFAHMSLGEAYKGLNINDEARKEYQTAIDIFEKQNDNGQFDDEILQAQKSIGTLK